MDLVAGLHWLRENLPAFNGNPNKVTLMGHGHGAALANILIVSPVASGMYYFCMTYVFVKMKHFPYRPILGPLLLLREREKEK
jgi:acetyl esterase/lipase